MLYLLYFSGLVFGIGVLLVVVWVLLEKEKLIAGLISFCVATILFVYTVINFLGYIEDEKLKKREVVFDVLSEEFETTDVYIVKKVESGGGYEKYEVIVDDELLRVVFVDDGSGEKRVIVDD